jgi:ATP-dependent Clp protease ATP-binding subunit ClpC
VDDSLHELIAAVRADPERVEELVAALTRAALPAARLVELAAAPEASLRRAVAAASRGRREAELVHALQRLAADTEVDVRRALARALLDAPGWEVPGVVQRLLFDAEPVVRLLAARAAASRPAAAEPLAKVLAKDDDWTVRQAAAEALGALPPPAALPWLAAILHVLHADEDADVARACAVALEGRILPGSVWPPGAPLPAVGELEAARARLVALGPPHHPRLQAWLDRRVLEDVDPEKIAPFGKDLTREEQAGRLPRAHGVDAAVDALVAAVRGPAPRAAVVVGPPGSGKTAVVHELVHRLARDPEGPWRVLRVSPSELLAGTVYLGEWQTKVRNLVEAVSAPRRAVLYVPNLEELSAAGRSSSSDLNVATMLAPHVESGAVAIVGESTTEAFRSGLGGIGSLRRLFPPVELRAMGEEDTLRVLEAVRDEAGLSMEDGDLERLTELASMYLSGSVEPGRSVGLLRRVADARAGREGPVTQRDVLETLSSSTGIPVDFLDDATSLDLAEVRAFFERRVMGQPEAVGAVVDLVTLVKAGLTDPSKPFGVLLFIGPTGVGKTELARALAELLFSDAGRLLRFDMSEYATPDAYERLIGFGSRPGTLTSAVREQPFSVVLLDEVEKSHLNVFDLCLQVFDAGRLTDAQGRTADFRRTIVILTSNVGSAVQTEASVGFGAADASPRAPDRDAVLAELRRWFRPEFLNRLDQVVHFRPLSLETAEKIARREVAAVVERSGLARRRLTIDVDAPVLSLLLRKGYSPAFGARPLKRTVERLVLLPVARLLASGRVPEGSVLRLLPRGEEVAVEVVLPEVAEDGHGSRPGVAAPGDVAARVGALVDRLQRMGALVRELEARKTSLFERMRTPNFWDDRGRSAPVAEEISQVEGILGLHHALHRRVRGLAEEVRSPRRRTGKPPRRDDVAEALEREARRVEFLLACREPAHLADAYLVLTRVRGEGGDLDGVGRLAAMYEAFSVRHGLVVETLDDHRVEDPADDGIVLSVQGVGAHALLRDEAGLHQWVRAKPEGSKRREPRPSREWVRVDVLPVPQREDPSLASHVTVRTRPLARVKGRRIARPSLEVSILHKPTMTSLLAWTDRPRARAVEALLTFLGARLQAAATGGADALAARPVRRYALGPSPGVKDRRSGRSTGNLKRVLAGDLDLVRAVEGDAWTT